MPANKKAIAKKAQAKSRNIKKSSKKTTAKSASLKKAITLPAVRPKAKSLYIDYSFFFPYNNGAYVDSLQDGRVATGDAALIAPILLPVGSVMKTVTIYYKNNTQQEISVWILKHHIDHHAYSGEVEVSYEACMGGVNPPDNFLTQVIDHFDAGGKILDKYMYHIEIGQTIKTATQERMLRGIRIVYTEPA